jgi:hypothetical protein
MNDNDKLELFNGLIWVITPVNSNCAEAKSLDDNLADTGLDSLDLLMMGIYLGDIYGALEDDIKDMEPITVRDMFDHVIKFKTKEPTSVHEAIESVK